VGLNSANLMIVGESGAGGGKTMPGTGVQGINLGWQITAAFRLRSAAGLTIETNPL